MTNVLYHMEHYLTQERYAHLRKSGPDERYLLDFEKPETFDFAMNIIDELARLFHTDYIHIGYDEFPIAPEQYAACGTFIRRVCTSMLEKGIHPAVWGDVFWLEQSMTDYLPKEVEIFDWNYYGHRPESLRYFKEQGFKKVYAVACDNGWEGFVGCQRARSFMKARADLPVKCDEVEAFFEDALTEHADGGMLSHWEDTLGRSIWTELVPLARAGLWMCGLWKNDIPACDQIEKVLFGRQTPYTALVEIFQKLQQAIGEHCRVSMPRNALFRQEILCALLNKPDGFWNAVILPMCEQTIAEAAPLLDSWIPQSAVESYAKDALSSTLANIRAASCMMQLASSRTIYRKASSIQYSDPDGFAEMLHKVQKICADAELALSVSMEMRLKSTAHTGITTRDSVWQKKLIAYLRVLRDRLSDFIAENYCRKASARPLLAWTEFIYEWEFTMDGPVV